MQVLEIKNNLVKIAYDVKDNLALSGFVIIEDTNTPYVAQVVNVKADKLTNFAIVKLLFTFNEEGILKNYNGTIPSLKSTVSILPSSELLDIIPVETPLVLGQLAQQNVTLNIDKTILDNNLLVCSDNNENTNTLINNIAKQIDEKVVIFDTDGLFETENKLVFGKDFKLPLNYNTINYIYENDLEDVDATSRAIIQDIFIEVQEYVKSLPEGYLPFDAFVNVIDQQYRETQIPQLILLKNKLLKYKEYNVFAETLKDVLSLSIAIDKNPITVIDVSDLTPELQKEIIKYSYGVMKNVDEDIYSFIKVDSSNSNKKLLKLYLSKEGIFTTIICRHEYKYLSELKSSAQNLILFAPQTLQHDFAGYNTFLNKLNPDEFIVYGAHTQNIPFIVELDELDLDNQDDDTENEENSEETSSASEEPTPTEETDTITQDLEEEINLDNNELPSSVKEDQQNSDDIDFSENETNNDGNITEFQTPDVEYPDIDINESPNFEESEAPQEASDSIDISEDTTFLDDSQETTEEVDDEQLSENFFEENEEAPIIEEDFKNNYVANNDISDNFEEEIIPADAEEPSEYSDENNVEEEIINEEIVSGEPQISSIEEEYTKTEDDNAPIYNILDDEEIDSSEPEVLPLEPEIDYSVEENDIEEDFQEPQPYNENDAMIEQAAKDVDKLIYEKLPDEDVNMNELSDLQTDELTEDDLNLIGDLASDNGITPEISEYPEEHPPVVPIYNANDIEEQEQQKLDPGDRVSTPKYGEGVVEKMIKYGNKMLCSIEFPNIGRRLLDPAMTEITKL